MLADFLHRIVHGIRGYYVGRKQTALFHVLSFVAFMIFATVATLLGDPLTIVEFVLAAMTFVVLDFVVFDYLQNKKLAKLGYKKPYADDPQADPERTFVEAYQKIPSVSIYKKMQDRIQKRFGGNQK